MSQRGKEQHGYVYAEYGTWYVMYRDFRVVDGSLKRVRLRKELGPVKHGTIDGLTRAQARELAKDQLAGVNKPKLNPWTAVKLVDFVEQVYFPRVEQQVRPSTATGYKLLWTQLKPFCEQFWIRDVRTKHIQDVLDDLAKTQRFGVNSMRNLKSFLRGVFRLAVQQDYYAGPNPVQQASIPKARASGETHAYSLDEIEAMLRVLPEPASTVIVTAALTGARRGELRGMRWENYHKVDGEDGIAGEMLIAQSVWHSHVTEPKSPKSKAVIPIIKRLATRLEVHRASLGNPTSGPIFPNEKGKPSELNNLLNRIILPMLRAAKIEWHGWHAFRRGLATNLHRLGVDDKTTQKILRHSNVTTTQDIYVKTVDADSRAAVSKVEAVLENREAWVN